MEAGTVREEIRQIESCRKQAFWWRTGALVALVLVVGGSLATLNSSVRGLVESGPRQDEFVGEFSQGLRTEIMPNVQSLTSQTLTEIQPQIKQEFTKLNTRVPELTDATLKELKTLQAELPRQSEKILDESYGKLLSSREAKIRQMYPDVTEEQVKTFVGNLQKTGETQIRQANDELFSPHQSALTSILDHMETIKSSEAAETKGVDPSWEMGLALLDVIRGDIATTTGAGDTKTSGATAPNPSGDKKAGDQKEVKK